MDVMSHVARIGLFYASTVYKQPIAIVIATHLDAKSLYRLPCMVMITCMGCYAFRYCMTSYRITIYWILIVSKQLLWNVIVWLNS